MLRRLARRIRPRRPRAPDTAGREPAPGPPAATEPAAYFDPVLRFANRVAPHEEALARTAMWPSPPPRHYLGQLAPEFQDQLARERERLTRDDCAFHHTIDLGRGEVVEGAWDLRGREDAYLGGVPLKGERVLELGPSSGHLTFHMERAGADVVAVEVGFDAAVDLLPAPERDPRLAVASAMQKFTPFFNSWWYAHRRLGSRARIVYGDIYDLPADLGTFDTAVFGAILLHLKRPFDALAQAARFTRSRVVIADLLDDHSMDLDEPVMRFAPQGPSNQTHWWSISPGAAAHMLRILGFGEIEATRHTVPHHPSHDLEAGLVEVPMYTIVGERG